MSILTFEALCAGSTKAQVRPGPLSQSEFCRIVSAGE
jgi:hypothetical protein